MPQRLLVLGAGPKALALAAKARALRELGIAEVPEVVAIDKEDVAANWDGTHGFTDGLQPLGTPPEKDVGFPYRSGEWGEEHNANVNAAMLAFSWYRYKVVADREEPFSTWIDRGRPQPTHGEWAKYLRWVKREVTLDVKIGEVIRADLAETPAMWRVIYETKNGVEEERGDGLVITGPGPSTSHHIQNCLDPVSFWNSIDRFSGATGLDICIIGAGETSAAAVAGLLGRLRESCRIFIVSPNGFIYSRGESYLENRVFSNPSTWDEKSTKDRSEFIRRTDRGVFSHAVQDKINSTHIYLQCLPGRVNLGSIEQAEDGGVVVDIQYDGQVTSQEFDFVLDAASSLKRLWFWDSIISPEARQRIELTLKDLSRDGDQRLEGEEAIKRALERHIDHYLRVRDFKPNLHLPMLAAMRRGPGFPNLSCLGLLSDQILQCYVSKL